MNLRLNYMRNHNNNDLSYVLGNYQETDDFSPSSVPDDIHFTVPEGKYFKEWNTERDGSGNTYYPNIWYELEEYPEPAENTDYSKVNLYAIWEDIKTYYVTNAELTILANEIRHLHNQTGSLEWPNGFVNNLKSPK